MVRGQVRIGMEATGNFRWFWSLLGELGHEVPLGNPSAIRASAPRRQKMDKLDARHILKLLLEDQFPTVWQPSLENEDTRPLLLQRCRLVRFRARVKNQLDSMAKNEGLLSKRVWCAMRRKEIEALPLSGWYVERRKDLLALLDELDKRVEPLDEAVKKSAEGNAEAPLLMTHPEVGPVVSLAYVLSRSLGEQDFLVRPQQSGPANLPLLLPQHLKKILPAFSTVCCKGFAHFPLPVAIPDIFIHQSGSVSPSLRLAFLSLCGITSAMLCRMWCGLLNGC
jgi:hypothetical protein